MNTARKLRTVFEKPKNRLSLMQNKSASFQKYVSKNTEGSTHDRVIKVLESNPSIKGKALYQKVANLCGETSLSKALKQEINSCIDQLRSSGAIEIQNNPNQMGLKYSQITYKNAKSTKKQPVQNKTQSLEAHNAASAASSSAASQEDQQFVWQLYRSISSSTWQSLSQLQELGKFRQSLCKNLFELSQKQQKPSAKQCRMGLDALCEAYDKGILDDNWFIERLELDPESLRVCLDDLN